MLTDNKERVKGMKLTNKMIECYLMECLGYDELMIDELKETWKPLKNCLNDEEKKECIKYYY